MGAVSLLVALGGGGKSINVNVLFIVVYTPSYYNAILGGRTLNPNMVIASIVHKKLKFLTPNRINKVLCDHLMSIKCYINCTHRRKTLPIKTKSGPRDNKQCSLLVENLTDVKIDGPKRIIRVGHTLSKEQIFSLTDLLIKYNEHLA